MLINPVPLYQLTQSVVSFHLCCQLAWCNRSRPVDWVCWCSGLDVRVVCITGGLVRFGPTSFSGWSASSSLVSVRGHQRYALRLLRYVSRRTINGMMRFVSKAHTRSKLKKVVQTYVKQRCAWWEGRRCHATSTVFVCVKLLVKEVRSTRQWIEKGRNLKSKGCKRGLRAFSQPSEDRSKSHKICTVFWKSEQMLFHLVLEFHSSALLVSPWLDRTSHLLLHKVCWINSVCHRCCLD